MTDLTDLVARLAELDPDTLASVIGDAVRQHADLANHPDRDRSTPEAACYLLADDVTELTLGTRWD